MAIVPDAFDLTKSQGQSVPLAPYWSKIMFESSDKDAEYLKIGEPSDDQLEPLHKRAFSILTAILGKDHLEVANKINAIAELYFTEGKLVEAEPLYWFVLAIREKALGLEHHQVALSLFNLASLYDSQERHSYAIKLYKTALAIMEKVFGPDHPDVAINMQNLAGSYVANGQYIEAVALYPRMLSFWEKTLGAEHPYMASRLERYAQLLRKADKVDEASQVEARSQEIRAKQKL